MHGLGRRGDKPPEVLYYTEELFFVVVVVVVIVYKRSARRARASFSLKGLSLQVLEWKFHREIGVLLFCSATSIYQSALFIRCERLAVNRETNERASFESGRLAPTT